MLELDLFVNDVTDFFAESDYGLRSWRNISSNFLYYVQCNVHF